MAVAPSVRPPLRFEILGPVRAVRGARELDLGPAKQRAVLAVLLLTAGRAVPTHQIVDAVWGDDPPENGANVVQKYVAGLRRILDPDRSPRTPGELLALTPAGYLLHVGAGALDVEQFRAGIARAGTERAEGRLVDASRTLKHALGLWHGDALAGLTGTAFEAARDRLTETHATAWEAWAEIELDRGNHSVLVPDLVRLVAEFPLREGLRALLMLALHQGGRQAEALAVFRDARRYLDEEFGVEPGERLQDAHRRILRNDPSLTPTRGAVPRQREPQPDAAPLPAAAVADRPAQYPAADPAAAAGTPAHITAPVRSPAEPTFATSAPFGNSGPPAAPAGQLQHRPGQPPLPVPGQSTPDPGLNYAAVVGAATLGLLSCGIGSTILIVLLGGLRRDWRQIVAGVAYGFAFLAMSGLVISSPTLDSDTQTSVQEGVGIPGMFVVWLASSLHAAILAARAPLSSLGRHAEQRLRRDQARRLLYANPQAARDLGIGRPDLPRWFDDGGLVDINHAPGHVLARLPGVTPEQAHRIVVDRPVHGPFTSADDLVTRGLLPAALTHRISPQIICVPPSAGAHAHPVAGPAEPEPSA